ncbi:tRNA (5-methylaminomethyl-2-thiouridine)(34)-methyltransferase MnmD [Oceanicella actignis]|uniref:tRNA U34 5-methylaminomethyl-2-thiouridine-forming methyltransferase MnmC n=1 Tax=Oceanicella actignis TaxID=1189325 RepID=A0A1M7T454_9RHOB|nr:tRNA (5-methylaminomethyl-2-thiouridine)(34)-methyltransferase MnmD [Oceanicella actignis]SET40935.1 tRNA U34 5-methylaminomethyl-2-thiouridine-forming methyltransferase MnmC [Oceanicella actignis]SHN65452.1 tRNA U34 5-methylaminomethyl-2-thiouridine-forming methyltransferase MnmC [Oceanicella actignis]
MSGHTSTHRAPAQDDLEWRGDTPTSRRFADPYYSPLDGLAEARHVFLEGADLTARMAAAPGGLHVAELGFGVGLNLLAAWRLHLRAGKGTLRFTSFEAHPLPAEVMARAHARWPELADLSRALCAAWRPEGEAVRAALPGLALEVRLGDARALVPRAGFEADVWFLDGFAPARNPQMWEPALMRAVFEACRPGGAAVTYSAAGAVRRALAAAGFEVRKRPGFARKREMLVALKPPAGAPQR